jgi:hypothetical protein
VIDYTRTYVRLAALRPACSPISAIPERRTLFDRLSAATAALESSLAALDPALLDGAGAVRLVECCVRIDRMVAAVKLRAARRVEETKAYAKCGHRSASGWLSDVAGTSSKGAADALSTAEQLEDLPATAQALADGLISEDEARHIASAASVDHKAEADLIAAAQRESHRRLQEEAARRRAAAMGDIDRDQRLHAQRRLSDWTDAEGAVCLSLRMAPDMGSRLLAAIDARAQKIFKDAYKAGRREKLSAYRLDALLALVETGDGAKVDAIVNVIIDYDALVRGNTEPGERCFIAGVGPVSVATARMMMSDSVLKLLVTDAVDVYSVAHAGRTVGAHLRSALQVRDPECCRPGCGERQRLQIHHFEADYHEVLETRLSNTARLCRFDHSLCTTGKARLDGGPGRWKWTDLTKTSPARR